MNGSSRHAPNSSDLPRLLATVGRPDLGTHLSQWGHRPVGRPALLGELERSGLTGRGGAGFPTTIKWGAVLSSTRSGCGVPLVVANGTEGEPASNKDKTLLLHAPHLVLDGCALAAEALGAPEVVICLEQSAGPAIRSVAAAISERQRHRIDRIPVRIEPTPPGYVSGEESALVNWLSRSDARPSFGRRPSDAGVHGRPTLVNNVETFADVALVARFGADWYRGLGTSSAPGTALMTVVGDVVHPAVYEVALGTPLSDVLRPAGPSSGVQAVLMGGYAGAWLAKQDVAQVTLDPVGLAPTGATLGCGSIVVVGENSCGLKATAAIAAWLAEQSAGQCGPCMHGLPAIADAVDRLVAPAAPKRWGAQIDRWLWMVEGRGACKHPDGAVRMVRSGLKAFAAEVDRHRHGGDCRKPSPPLVLPRPAQRRAG